MSFLYRRCCGDTGGPTVDGTGSVLSPAHGRDSIENADGFRKALAEATSYIEVLHIIRNITEAKTVRLESGDWQSALRKAGPHAHAVRRQNANDPYFLYTMIHTPQVLREVERNMLNSVTPLGSSPQSHPSQLERDPVLLFI